MSTKINLGMEVYDPISGMVTENLPLNNFKGNLLISGGARNERTALLSHVLNQFYARLPDIGVLLIQLGSNEDTYLYHLDKMYKYGDPELNIPYYTGHWFNMLNRERFMNYMNAVFGFHYEMSFVIDNLTRHYKRGSLPSSIVDFLEDLKRYLIKHPFHEEFTEGNVKSFVKTIKIFQADPVLESTLSIPLKGIPEWLNLWKKGKKICIDLTKCDTFQQRLLVTLITQAILKHVDHNNSDIPTGVVVIEDVDDIRERLPYEEYKKNYESNREYYRAIREESYVLTPEQIAEVYGDDNYLMNVQLEQIHRKLIGNEFRYRNISQITVCKDFEKIYEYVNYYSQIKLQVDEVK
ncbi:hypothetical protein LCGC14_1282280 [marine sediment metagenome]|uniref:Uncharacterized protein n=1 Tax=marine sediment metagenome TaxID=412755 RepID=A0A0F9KUV9_9ZZZZ